MANSPVFITFDLTDRSTSPGGIGKRSQFSIFFQTELNLNVENLPSISDTFYIFCFLFFCIQFKLYRSK